jgi:Signal transduction histidine kinase
MLPARINIKKTKHAIIKGLIMTILLAIIGNQIVWLHNMYNLYQREFNMNADQAVLESSLMELAERSEILGGATVYSHNINPPNDTSRFFKKNVVTEDSTYTFTLDKNDPNTMPKITQFVLKKYFPIDLDRFSAIFKIIIQERYSVHDVYFDYLDLENDTLIKTNRLENITTSHYIKTDTIPLDIISSIGIVGYIQNSHAAILDKMINQLLLSVVLIIIAVVSLFYISRSFVFQWKTEKMRQDSVNMMTHEFKRPISNAVAMTALIPFYMEKGDTGKVLNYTQNIQNELNKLTYYTKRIQQISNNEKGNVALNKTDVEITSFFESLQQRYTISREESERKISINVQIRTAKKKMHVDFLHFSNVMDNLVENALKYTVKPTAIIDISVSDVPGALKISVKDNGIGISSTDIKYIFDKFYRVKREETKNKMGFGLGLTYVKSIIEAHEGDITVNSNLNEGSEFIIRLKS